MSDVSIRPLTPDDWQAFQALRLEALKAYPHFYCSSYQSEAGYDQEKIKKYWLNGGNKSVFGLFDGDALIGITGVFTWKEDAAGKTGVMGASYIRPSHQGRGYSRLLYQARIDWAMEHKEWSKLVVSHRASNERSRRANQAFGFVLTHKSSHAWPDGTHEDELHYEMDLAARRAHAARQVYSSSQDVF
ncbi:MAG: GNAT family N-acetyltransferase [Bdellovibrionales bacterium]